MNGKVLEAPPSSASWKSHSQRHFVRTAFMNFLTKHNVRSIVSDAETTYLKSANAWAVTQRTIFIDDLLEMREMRGPNSKRAALLMSPDEGLLLLDLLRGKHTKHYIEWGSGGSTELISWLLMSKQLSHASSFRAYSVESSLPWIETLNNRSSLVAQAVSEGQLRFLHGDFGPTGVFGFPKEEPSRLPSGAAMRYIDPVDVPSQRKFDVALVDGRFRVACAYSAALRLAPNGTILLHDFGPPMLPARRSEYESLLREGHFSLKSLVLVGGAKAESQAAA